MRQLDIKERIDKNNNLIEKFMAPNKFVLNNIVAELLYENKKLQDQCKHEFDDGICIYCYKMEEE